MELPLQLKISSNIVVIQSLFNGTTSATGKTARKEDEMNRFQSCLMELLLQLNTIMFVLYCLFLV